jgi:hypothetical protein
MGIGIYWSNARRRWYERVNGVSAPLRHSIYLSRKPSHKQIEDALIELASCFGENLQPKDINVDLPDLTARWGKMVTAPIGVK